MTVDIITIAAAILVHEGAHTGKLEHHEATDAMIMLVRTAASLRGATPVEVQRDIHHLTGVEEYS